MKFLGEFKRRKVLNTASLYVLGVWVLLQVLEVLQQFFPPGAMRWVLIGAAALYPLVFLALDCNNILIVGVVYIYRSQGKQKLLQQTNAGSRDSIQQICLGLCRNGQKINTISLFSTTKSRFLQ